MTRAEPQAIQAASPSGLKEESYAYFFTLSLGLSTWQVHATFQGVYQYVTLLVINENILTSLKTELKACCNYQR